MPKFQTSDECGFISKLANANMEKINRIRRGLKPPRVSRDGLLPNYIEAGKERDWVDVDGRECLAAAEAEGGDETEIARGVSRNPNGKPTQTNQLNQRASGIRGFRKNNNSRPLERHIAARLAEISFRC